MAPRHATGGKGKPGSRPPRVGERILSALTQEESARLLDAVLAALPAEARRRALGRLGRDTGQTVEQIVEASTRTGAPAAPEAQPVTTARQAQTWSELWSEWHAAVDEAPREQGKYWTQDAHWEPPYFDDAAFVSDVDEIASRMQPLLRTAFEQGFAPDAGFAQALLETEESVRTGLPEWMEIVNGFGLEPHLTRCVLEWEWLAARAKNLDAFGFARCIREWEERATQTTLDPGAFAGFFAQLAAAEQRAVFQGLDRERDELLWKKHLQNPYSHWHALFLGYTERFAPGQYFVRLRTTIGQRWQNGLPVIEDLLARKDYRECLAVIEQVLRAMPGREPWTPETSLLFARLGASMPRESLSDHKALLRDYERTARGLGAADLENVLRIQRLALDHGFDWERMLAAFGESVLPASTRQALFQSWRDYIVQQARPGTGYLWGFSAAGTEDTWWLDWLIEAAAGVGAEPTSFGQKLGDWLRGLRFSGERDANVGYLRLLTTDLAEQEAGGHRSRYPQFCKIVLTPGLRSTSDQASRRAYLRRLAPSDVWETVMGIWKAQLRGLVPDPGDATGGYTRHAEWMVALREIAPHAQAALLDQWRLQYPRRRNLWKALEASQLT
ncbi:MAG: hypothetical protein AB1505_08900 [Candidatus Latescibacterota bacterium]